MLVLFLCFPFSGKQFIFPLVTQFLGHWHHMGTSLKAATIYKAHFNQGWLAFSETRWWSSWEQVAQQFPRLFLLPAFFRSCITRGVCAETASHLLELVQQPAFRVQVTGYVELGRLFVTTTYSLEG
ncbi:MAG: hypothetical protein WCR59_11405, partial [Planctomycetota bacterium]